MMLQKYEIRFFGKSLCVLLSMSSGPGLFRFFSEATIAVTSLGVARENKTNNLLNLITN